MEKQQLVTKDTFKGKLEPADIEQIHRLLKPGVTVDISIWTPEEVKVLEGKRSYPS